jgi:hypothetical protein
MLDEASRIELGFPYELYAKELPRTFAYGGLRDRILACSSSVATDLGGFPGFGSAVRSTETSAA